MGQGQIILTTTSTITSPTDLLPWLPFVLQTADPLFPTGSYAHSLGLEEIVRLELVKDEATLEDFLLLHLAPMLEHFELPCLRFAYSAAVAGDGDELRLLNDEVDAFKLAEETRQASRQIGARRLRALANILPQSRPSLEIDPCHHLVASGIQFALEDVPLQAALAVWGYQSFAAMAAAALKLIRIGQDGVQRVLRSACACLPQLLADSLALGRAEIGHFSPVLEIASMRHQRAQERLFIS